MLEQGAKTEPFRAVPAAIFIFDCSRLLFLIALLFFALEAGPGFGVVNLPMMMFAAPNALFPLMAFFLLIRGGESKAYVPLYIVGKTLCMLCALVWVFVSLTRGPGFVVSPIAWLVFMVLSAADLATIIGTAASAEPATASALPDETAADGAEKSAALTDTIHDDVKTIPGGG